MLKKKSIQNSWRTQGLNRWIFLPLNCYYAVLHPSYLASVGANATPTHLHSTDVELT